MVVATGSVALAGTTLEGLILPRGVRTITPRVITAEAAIAEGAESASLTSSATSTVIKAGSSLSFNAATPTGDTNRKQMIFREDATLGTTAATASIMPLFEAIAEAEVADYYPGLIPIFGLQEFGLQGQSTTVDTTNTLSGTGMEMQVVRNGRDFSISLISAVADRGLEEVAKELAINRPSREGFFVLTYPDGERFLGAGKIQNPNFPGNQNEVKRCSFTLTFQGDSFRWIKPHTFAA